MQNILKAHLYPIYIDLPNQRTNLDFNLKQKTKNVNESATAKDKLVSFVILLFSSSGTILQTGTIDSVIQWFQAPGSFHLVQSEGSSSRRVVDSSSREPFSGGSDNANYESALKGIDGLRINSNAGDETAASPQSNGDDTTPRLETKAKLSETDS